MARKTVLISDLNGESIEDGRGAKLRITYMDARRGVYELDVTGDEPEIVNMLSRGRKVNRRGRKPSTA